MSASSVSNALARPARRGLVAALILLGAAGVAGAAGAAPKPSREPRAAAGDSERVHDSFEIDRNGVRIRTSARGRSEPAVDIRIDPRLARSSVTIGGAAGDSEGRRPSVEVNGPAIVVDTDGAGLVRVFADAEVPAGERVEGDVVAVFGSVSVEGSVTGNVVAVFGSVRLAPGAAVEGDVVAIGGGLDQAPGATVGGESVSLGFLPVSVGLPTLPVLLVAVFLGWLLSLFMGWLMTMLFPERMLRVAATASRRGIASFFLGLVSPPLVLLTCLLLVITVIGLPIAALLPFLYVIMVWAGQIAATYVLGSRLLRRRLGQGGAMMPILTGTVFVAMFFVAGALLAAPPGFARTAALFFCLLGVLLIFCLTAIGTGAFLLSRMGTRPREVTFERAPGSAALPEVPAGASAPPTPSGA
ncbi:MAG TPA: polymer-forming cytoskeletal protein [Candidatus Eisenbacteria bacterium]|jgi:hypothetical protein